MAVFTYEVLVVEHEEMKRPVGAPDQLWGGPWLTPEVMVVQVEAESASAARLLVAQMAHYSPGFVDPYVVGVRDPEEGT